VALAWTLTNPAVTALIIGARTLAQLDDNLGALGLELSEEQLARLDEAGGRPRLPARVPQPSAHPKRGLLRRRADRAPSLEPVKCLARGMGDLGALTAAAGLETLAPRSRGAADKETFGMTALMS
jgi:hypothetical protein